MYFINNNVVNNNQCPLACSRTRWNLAIPHQRIQHRYITMASAFNSVFSRRIFHATMN